MEAYWEVMERGGLFRPAALNVFLVLRRKAMFPEMKKTFFK
jgi:hypothetical protein